MDKVIMPKLGPDMESGTIQKWIKKEGDKVAAGDVLLEIMTDKVTMEIEATSSGYLKKIVCAEGEEVPVTTVIGYIGEKNEKIP
ncbi:MAG: hypothetical protein FJW61_07675 [Actinobacteria bacterium]|nr:hypothetical protein [Actinomycetota bacterium]